MRRERIASIALRVGLALILPIIVVVYIAALGLEEEALLALVASLGAFTSLLERLVSKKTGEEKIRREAEKAQPPLLLVDTLEQLVEAYCSNCGRAPPGYKCLKKSMEVVLSKT